MTDDRPANPYDSPVVAELVPQSRVERQVLDFYWLYRETSPTVLAVVARHVPAWLLLGFPLLLAAGVATFALGTRDGVWIVAFLIGMFSGVVIRDWSYSQRFVRIWPMLQQILDWEKISLRRASTHS